MTSEEFEYIAKGLRSAIMGVAAGYFHNKEDLEDVVQEIMLRLWLRREQLESNIEGLAVHATRNYCISIWRKQRLREMVDIEGIRSVEDNVGADSYLLAADKERLLDAAIGKLSRSEQRIIRLIQQDNLEAPEIATITGLKLHSIQTIISSARRKLLKLLTE